MASDLASTKKVFNGTATPQRNRLRAYRFLSNFRIFLSSGKQALTRVSSEFLFFSLATNICCIFIINFKRTEFFFVYKILFSNS